MPRPDPTASDPDEREKKCDPIALRDSICESIGCSWQVVEAGGSDRLLISDAGAGAGAEGTLDERLAERVDLALKGARFQDVLQAMSNILEIDSAIDTELTQLPLLTIDLHQARLSEILDQICEQASCRWEIEGSSGKEPRLLILPVD